MCSITALAKSKKLIKTISHGNPACAGAFGFSETWLYWLTAPSASAWNTPPSPLPPWSEHQQMKRSAVLTLIKASHIPRKLNLLILLHTLFLPALVRRFNFLISSRCGHNILHVLPWSFLLWFRICCALHQLAWSLVTISGDHRHCYLVVYLSFIFLCLKNNEKTSLGGCICRRCEKEAFDYMYCNHAIK